MLLDGSMGERETEARSVGLGGEEGREDALPVGEGDARSPSSIRTRLTGRPSTVASSLATRIAPPFGIASDALRRMLRKADSRRTRSPRTESPLPRRSIESVIPLRSKLSRIDSAAASTASCRAKVAEPETRTAAKLEHAAHDAVEAVDLAQRDLHRLRELRRDATRAGGPLEHLKVEFDRGERIANLVETCEANSPITASFLLRSTSASVSRRRAAMVANAAASLPTSLASWGGSCGAKCPCPTSSAAIVSFDSARVARHNANKKSTATVAGDQHDDQQVRYLEFARTAG